MPSELFPEAVGPARSRAAIQGVGDRGPRQFLLPQVEVLHRVTQQIREVERFLRGVELGRQGQPRLRECRQEHVSVVLGPHCQGALQWPVPDAASGGEKGRLAKIALGCRQIGQGREQLASAAEVRPGHRTPAVKPQQVAAIGKIAGTRNWQAQQALDAHRFLRVFAEQHWRQWANAPGCVRGRVAGRFRLRPLRRGEPHREHRQAR